MHLVVKYVGEFAGLIRYVAECGVNRAVSVQIAVAAAGGPPTLWPTSRLAERRLTHAFKNSPHGGTIIWAASDQNVYVIPHDRSAEDLPTALDRGSHNRLRDDDGLWLD